MLNHIPKQNQANINNDVLILLATLYYRWSTSGQIKEKRFINNQVEMKEREAVIKSAVEKCIKAIESYRGFCPKCNREIRLAYVNEHYLDKGVSGRKSEREDVQRLIDDAESRNFQVVVTPMASRIGRRRSATAVIRDDLKDLGVQIYSLGQPLPIKCPDCFDPMDDDSAIINESVSDMQSELDLAQIRRNYKTGMPIRIQRGKPAGSLPYGLIKRYRVLGKDSKGNDMLEEYYEWDNQKTGIVERIAKEYLEGTGTWRISQGLNIEGIPSPEGRKWGRSAILVLLKNPAYAGLNRWRWKISKNGKRIIQSPDKWMLEKACYKGLWDEAYYKRVQDELARRETVGGRAVASDSLLISLLKCGYCHYSMFKTKTNRIQKNGTPYKYRGYGCGTFIHRGTCQHNGIKQEVLDTAVLKEVAKLFNEKTKETFMKKLHRNTKEELQELIKNKAQAISSATKEFQRAKKAYLEGVDSLSEYSQNKDRYEPAIQTLQTDILKLEEKLKNVENITSLDNAYAEIILRFLTMPKTEDKKKVKVILNQIIDRIEFTKSPYSVKIFYKLS